MSLTLTVSTRRDERLVETAGELDFSSVAYLRRLAFDLFDLPIGRLVIDVSAATLIDGAATGVLLYLQRRGHQRGVRVTVTGASGTALAALDIAGVAKQLGVFETIEWPQDERDRVPVSLHNLNAPESNWPPLLTGLLIDLQNLAQDDPRRSRLRERIIEEALPAAHRLARRFGAPGESSADLAQVAALGLVKAVDGFDADFGTDFGVYATPTILGELKRYMRDRTWGIRVPRRLQELRLAVNRCSEELTTALDHSPTIAELAAHLGVTEHRILEVLTTATAYRPLSLQSPANCSHENSWADLVGHEDPGYEQVEHHEALRVLLRRLPRREQQILGLRFYGNLTQAEIAGRVGLSQMHVSRILHRCLEALQRGLVDG